MKILFRIVLKLAPVLLILTGGVATTMAQGAKLQLDQLDMLANRASETVDVKLDEHLMQTTAKFFSGKDNDDAEDSDAGRVHTSRLRILFGGHKFGKKRAGLRHCVDERADTFDPHAHNIAALRILLDYFQQKSLRFLEFM